MECWSNKFESCVSAAPEAQLEEQTPLYLHLMALSAVNRMKALILQSCWLFLRKLLLNSVSSNDPRLHLSLLPNLSLRLWIRIQSPRQRPWSACPDNPRPFSLPPSSVPSFPLRFLCRKTGTNISKSGRFSSQGKPWLEVEIIANKQ